MRIAKMLGLAALTALAAMAIMGATASVSQGATTLCKVDVTPCPGGEKYGVGTEIKAKVIAPAQATLKAEKENGESLPNVTCQTSEVEGVLTEEGDQLKGEINKLNFLNCTAGKLFNCTVTVEQLKYLASDVYTSQGKGTFTVYEKELGQPGARVTCPIVGLDCIFKTEEANTQEPTKAAANLAFQGHETAPTVTATQVPLKRITPTGGNCLQIKVARWDAVYTVSTPVPAFQSQ